MDFWRVVGIFGKRKWLLLLSVVVATALTWGATRLIGSKWVAVVQFVQPQTSTLLNIGMDQTTTEGNAGENMVAANAQANIYKAIVQSRDVLEPALKKLQISQLPPDLLKNIDFVASAPRLFQLKVTDSSPVRAGELSNAIADQCVIVYQNVRTRQAKETVTLLERQLHVNDTRLMQARARYDAFRSARGITSAGGNDALLEKALEDATHMKSDAQQKLAAFQAELGKVSSDLRATPKTISQFVPAGPNPMIGQLKDELATLDQNLSDLRLRYPDTSSKIVQAVTARKHLADRLAVEQAGQAGTHSVLANPEWTVLATQARTLQEQSAAEQAQLGIANTAVASAVSDLKKYQNVDTHLAALAGEIGTQLEQKNNMAARLHSARMTYDAASGATPIAIMDRVSAFNPATNSTEGRTTKLIAIAALLALVGSGAIAVALDSVDLRLKSVQQAEIALPTRILAAIPQPMGEISYGALARVTELFPQSLQAEAFRFVAMHLLGENGPKFKSLMMVSAKAEQGSTTALTNLGITLAQAGKKVIIVDANIRTPELHQVFEFPDEFGFVDLIRSPDDKSIARALTGTTVANLQVISSGQKPDNPWELFRSPNMGVLSEKLRGQADYVLYDTPSSVIFTDALNLSPIVDAAVLCVRALEPLSGAEDRLVKMVEQHNVPVVGCIINDVPSSIVEGFDNYQNHYVGPNNGAAMISPAASPAQGWMDVPKTA